MHEKITQLDGYDTCSESDTSSDYDTFSDSDSSSSEDDNSTQSSSYYSSFLSTDDDEFCIPVIVNTFRNQVHMYPPPSLV